MKCATTFFFNLPAICLAAGLVVVPVPVLSQEETQPLPDIEVGSEKFFEQDQLVQIRLLRQPVIDSLDELKRLVPALDVGGAYEYSGDETELQAIIGLMTQLADDLSIGKPLYQQVSAGIADAKALHDATIESPVFDDQEDVRQQLLSDIQDQINRWEDLRVDFDLLRNQMNDFVSTRGPAIEEEYRIRSSIDRNAKVLEEFEDLRNAAQDFLQFAIEDAPTSGSD